MVAFGDGLVTACEGKTASFVVDGKGKRGDLVVHVEGMIGAVLLYDHAPQHCVQHALEITRFHHLRFNDHCPGEHGLAGSFGFLLLRCDTIRYDTIR